MRKRDQNLRPYVFQTFNQRGIYKTIASLIEDGVEMPEDLPP